MRRLIGIVTAILVVALVTDRLSGRPGIWKTLFGGSSADCQIKGNISVDGTKIYHVPGGEWYEKTKIDAQRGERWFCSEEEARAAGWRKSLK
jgi:hypothetical protein